MLMTSCHAHDLLMLCPYLSCNCVHAGVHACAAGRVLGEEVRYVLERRQLVGAAGPGGIRPGVMLDR